MYRTYMTERVKDTHVYTNQPQSAHPKETRDESKRAHFRKKIEEYLARAEDMKTAAQKQKKLAQTHKQVCVIVCVCLRMCVCVHVCVYKEGEG